MKTILLVTVSLILVTSTANAGNWAKIERPCGSKCVTPQQTTQTQTQTQLPPFTPIHHSGTAGDSNVRVPTYQSNSRTVIQTRYGTSVINSTYRAY